MSKALRSLVVPRAIPAWKRFCVQIRISPLTPISHQSQRARRELPLYMASCFNSSMTERSRIEETSAASVAAETPRGTYSQSCQVGLAVLLITLVGRIDLTIALLPDFIGILRRIFRRL
jgi:hypothetical protein